MNEKNPKIERDYNGLEGKKLYFYPKLKTTAANAAEQPKQKQPVKIEKKETKKKQISRKTNI